MALFKHPFKLIIAGPSNSGKSVWIGKLLSRDRKRLPKRIIWYYGSATQPKLFSKLKKIGVTFKYGPPDKLHPNSLIIIDDLKANGCYYYCYYYYCLVTS